MAAHQPQHRQRTRAPKAAGIAGVVFSILLMISLVLLLTAIPTSANGERLWWMGRQDHLLLALNLIPFAGIAFLWFIGVVRDLLGEREDQFFATIFLGSGLLFVALLFVSAALIGSVVMMSQALAPGLDGISEARPWQPYHYAGSSLFSTYGIRMAGVFMISTCTLFLRTHAIPAWMAWVGYGLAAIMLFRIGQIDHLGWVVLGFPLWVLLISVYILVTSYRQR
ncbi:MAG: hypothetical protein VKL98_04445 [Cyanobacteriota bacterium]|nr:hypothetical protein [Cyanobacteriota bacterium]